MSDQRISYAVPRPNSLGKAAGLALGLTLLSLTGAFAGDVTVDGSVLGRALKQEDGAAIQSQLLPVLVLKFGDKIQVRNTNVWLMRTFPQDSWNRVQMCAEVRITESGATPDWLPAVVWATPPYGDQPSAVGGRIAGWDKDNAERRFKSFGQLEPSAIENDSEMIRTECGHTSDDSQAAIAKGLLKRLAVAP